MATAARYGMSNLIGLLGFKPPTKDMNVTVALEMCIRDRGAAGRPEDQAADDNREYGAGLYGGETIRKPGNLSLIHI